MNSVGREFVDLFNRWAATYDETVYGGDKEYAAVFENYDELLDAVASQCRGVVLEFGLGTGNLTARLVQRGLQVIGVEPSEEMRKIARKRIPNVPIFDGDFLQFNLPTETVDTIVSTYAFHHLTDDEKALAIAKFNRLLPVGGQIVFADTAFQSADEKAAAIERAKQNQFLNLAVDLETEYYPTLGTLARIFDGCGFEFEFTKWNDFVWLIRATKVRDAAGRDDATAAS
jgi:putative AdoMet-dependent methyltransferase